MMSDLDRLEEAIKTGKINVTAYYIWKYLQSGQRNYALQEYYHDGDKLGEYRVYIQPILGCRLHGKMNCDSTFCTKIKIS